MNSHFPRIIALLRKERGLSQKSVAASLGVSQALLSHYEKGIRECGLDFVVRIADFYGVSCDYLLGRTPHPTGATAVAPAQPQADAGALHQGLLANALAVLYGVLDQCGSETLSGCATDYLFAAVYRAFRVLYSANSKNPQAMFAVPPPLADGYASAQMDMALAEMACLLSGRSLSGEKGLAKADLPSLNPEKLAEAFPDLAASFFTLLQQVEARMGTGRFTGRQKAAPKPKA